MVTIKTLKTLIPPGTLAVRLTPNSKHNCRPVTTHPHRKQPTHNKPHPTNY
ncbi:hypothetical protein Cfor_01905 [Coptotermes formosanus]|uniref:Uncharacterized protein n=1 Tax=Coptotermes formosanus TaxID=36987 RepID=A0A6L2Q0N5_COPFO|nr:hypothetical protein Cfor_01905 [Coptotermes formosanus]